MEDLNITLTEAEMAEFADFSSLSGRESAETRSIRTGNDITSKELVKILDGITTHYAERRNHTWCLFQLVFIEQIVPYIEKNPGCLQKYIKKCIPVTGYPLYDDVSKCLYFLAQEHLIIRENAKGTYKLFLNSDVNTITDYIRLNAPFGYMTPTDIPAESFPQSDRIIIEYFGNKTINALLTTIKANTPQQPPETDINYLLSNIGACVKFEIDDTLQNIIDKYWQSEIEIKYREFLAKHGFFSDQLFLRKLRDIIGDQQYESLVEELYSHAPECRIKWCGYYWQSIKPYHILWDYLQSFKFKWGLQPSLLVKKCKYCSREFMPSYELRDIIDTVMETNSNLRTVNDVIFCKRHALGEFVLETEYMELKDLEQTKSRMLSLLKRLIDIIGIIPPSNFKKDLSYLKEMDLCNYEETIKILCEMPLYETHYSSRFTYKGFFGSWLKTLMAGGIIEEGGIRMSRGYKCLAVDGHECYSLGEKSIDDWMYRHGIEHEKEPRYPGMDALRGDWKVGKCIVEFWGMIGNEDYDNKILVKREIAKEHRLTLVEITPDDLNRLENIFGRKDETIR